MRLNQTKTTHSIENKEGRKKEKKEKKRGKKKEKEEKREKEKDTQINVRQCHQSVSGYLDRCDGQCGLLVPRHDHLVLIAEVVEALVSHDRRRCLLVRIESMSEQQAKKETNRKANNNRKAKNQETERNKSRRKKIKKGRKK